jgi:Flp pilus assembly protein TadG
MTRGGEKARSARWAVFGRDERGTLAVGFGLALVGVVSATGAAVDLAKTSNQRAKMQAVVDGAVMAGVRQFRLGNASESVVQESVRSFVQASLDTAPGAMTVSALADANARTVSATLAASVPTYFLHFVGGQFTAVSVKASAKLAGGAPVCVLGLDTDRSGTINLERSAVLSAPGCAIYSNSKKPDGLRSKEAGSLTASFICSAGGKVSDKFSAFSPTPRTDCPVLPDPLRVRPLPSPGACAATDMVVTGTTVNLSPGTYCGGLKLTSAARVNLTPGVYIFRGGRLEVGKGSVLTGINVALHFSGKDATLQFDPDSSISLTAPKKGDMAGLLITEDRSNPEDQKFNILSNDARMLLGTIYLPKGRLYVGANKPVADQSAYTIVVARMFSLSEGPTMVLNTNYGSTDVPVPDGVGPGSSVQLTH